MLGLLKYLIANGGVGDMDEFKASSAVKAIELGLAVHVDFADPKKNLKITMKGEKYCKTPSCSEQFV